MTPAVYQPSLQRIDYLILLGYCTILFGISLVGGRPLSRHEAVLPQSSREMALDHDWVVPKSGGRPWLESPPLPQWITVAVTSVVGHGSQVWPYRIAPAAMATGVVLLAAWMASGWRGRRIGLVSGLAMATLSEFTRYAWLAEDEIFLCFLVAACTAAFVRLEFFGGLPAENQPYRFFGSRPRGVLLFFVLLGATNLAKGVLFGMALTLVTIIGYWVMNRDWRAVRPYIWCWGWLATLAVASAWPAAALHRFPDVANVWFYDQLGRVSGNYTEINQPAWYYLKYLPEEIAPWTLIALVGLALTAKAAFGQKRSPERFLWCWAWMPLAALSVPSGKPLLAAQSGAVVGADGCGVGLGSRSSRELAGLVAQSRLELASLGNTWGSGHYLSGRTLALAGVEHPSVDDGLGRAVLALFVRVVAPAAAGGDIFALCRGGGRILRWTRLCRQACRPLPLRYGVSETSKRKRAG